MKPLPLSFKFSFRVETRKTTSAAHVLSPDINGQHCNERHNVQSLPELMKAAHENGARLIACTMTTDLLGIAPSDLIDGVEFGDVASILGEAESHNTIFI